MEIAHGQGESPSSNTFPRQEKKTAMIQVKEKTSSVNIFLVKIDYAIKKEKKAWKRGLYMCISSERSEFKDAGTAALQEKARFPYPLQRNAGEFRSRSL